MKPPTTTVRVGRPTAALLKRLAAERGQSIPDYLADLASAEATRRPAPERVQHLQHALREAAALLNDL